MTIDCINYSQAGLRLENPSTPVMQYCTGLRASMRKKKKLEKGSKRKERRKRERLREGGEDEKPHENRLLCKSILSQISQQSEIFYHHDEV